jgi:hypothetical protein
MRKAPAVGGPRPEPRRSHAIFTAAAAMNAQGDEETSGQDPGPAAFTRLDGERTERPEEISEPSQSVIPFINQLVCIRLWPRHGGAHVRPQRHGHVAGGGKRAPVRPARHGCRSRRAGRARPLPLSTPPPTCAALHTGAVMPGGRPACTVLLARSR